MASSIQVLASGTSENESVHEMGFVSTFHPLRDLCHSVTVTRACTEALGHWRSADFYAQGTPLGTGDVAESCDDRCILNRLGCHPGGNNSERFVAEETMFSTHKLFGAYDYMESSELFSASPAGTSCARTLQQLSYIIVGSFLLHLFLSKWR